MYKSSAETSLKPIKLTCHVWHLWQWFIKFPFCRWKSKKKQYSQVLWFYLYKKEPLHTAICLNIHFMLIIFKWEWLYGPHCLPWIKFSFWKFNENVNRNKKKMVISRCSTRILNKELFVLIICFEKIMVFFNVKNKLLTNSILLHVFVLRKYVFMQLSLPTNIRYINIYLFFQN